MFDQDEFDPSTLPLEDDLFVPGELLTPEEFVSLTLDAWHKLEDGFVACGDKKAANELAIAIKILKQSFSVRELVDLSAYEKQLQESA